MSRRMSGRWVWVSQTSCEIDVVHQLPNVYRYIKLYLLWVYQFEPTIKQTKPPVVQRWQGAILLEMSFFIFMPSDYGKSPSDYVSLPEGRELHSLFQVSPAGHV